MSACHLVVDVRVENVARVCIDLLSGDARESHERRHQQVEDSGEDSEPGDDERVDLDQGRVLGERGTKSLLDQLSKLETIPNVAKVIGSTLPQEGSAAKAIG